VFLNRKKAGSVARRRNLTALRSLEVWLVSGPRKIPSPDAALGDGLLAARATPPDSFILLKIRLGNKSSVITGWEIFWTTNYAQRNLEFMRTDRLQILCPT